MAFEPSRQEQLTESKLSYGYWWVTHKVKVRMWTSIALAIFDFIFIGYAVFGFADWYFGSGAVERNSLTTLTTSLTDFNYFNQKAAPQQLAVDNPIVLMAGEGTYDLAANATNPNTQWLAEFDYGFGGTSGPMQHGYLLPGETSWLTQLGVKSASQPDAGQFAMQNLVWHRINAHVAPPDYATWSAARLKFDISAAAFVPPAPTDPIAVSRAQVTVTNDTGFGYYAVPFFVTLLSGSTVVGINEVTISDFRPGDQRQVEASWYADLPNVTSVEAIPKVNILDDSVYIPPGQ
jgi:hypothetical protein